LSNPRARAPAVAELWKPPVVRDSPHVRAVIEDDAKLIKSYDGRLEFYDLKTDPAESEPTALGDTRRLSLREQAVWLESLSSRAREQKVSPPLDEATVERLRALGYTP
jgi:hypothetical protein